MLLNQITELVPSLKAYEAGLVNASSNIANLETIGYKTKVTRFSEIYSQVLQGATEKTNPIQLGGAMRLGETAYDFSQGELVAGGARDAAINGQGFFIVSPDGIQMQLTRGGSFGLSSDGRSLIDANGRQVYGFTYGSSSLAAITFPSGTTESQIQITTGGVITRSGAPEYILALTNVPNQSGLESVEGSAFQETMSSGTPFTPTISGGTGYVGIIEPGKVETSNTNLIEQTTLADVYNRDMQAVTAMISLLSQRVDAVIKIFG